MTTITKRIVTLKATRAIKRLSKDSLTKSSLVIKLKGMGERRVYWSGCDGFVNDYRPFIKHCNRRVYIDWADYYKAYNSASWED